MTPSEEPDLLVRLLRDAYGAPPPADPFVQSLGLRLRQELLASQARRRRWRCAIAVAACVLLSAAIAFFVLPRREANILPTTEPDIIQIGPSKPQPTVPETAPDIRHAR